LQARPEILGALADYASAEASLRLEVAKQYPDFHFSPGYTWDQGADRWSIGVGFTLPVLNRNRGAIAKAEADRQSAATRFEALQAKTLGDLENARADYLASRESLRLADELAEKQRMQLTAVEGQFKAGAIGRTELVAARIAFDEAQLAQLTLFVQVQTSFGGLQDAVARPLDGSGPSAGSPGAAPSL
jgi:outer membrane protein TolC